ncbi:MAG: hypothetical protein KDA37_15355 [Planctomycetales bacterium]|nr:hypothetical protein [Planctomycetales bacterium]
MSRTLALCFAAVAAVTIPSWAQPEASYQRRGSHYQNYGPPSYQPPLTQGPAVAAGTFQRPYPYHLDYYRQRYGGSYAPYFGNLYGPPGVVVGATPYGYGYGFPVPYAPPAEAAPLQPSAPQTQALICPHCGQPIYFAAPPSE